MLPNKCPDTDRVKHELRAIGIKSEQANPKRSGIHTRGYLPHVKREGARYFITFRLADVLPRDVLLKYQAERAERLERCYADVKASEQLGTPRRTTGTPDEIERDYRRK